MISARDNQRDPRVLVNARFRVHRITGMQRYAVEVTKRLASFVEYCEPSVRSGVGGHVWEQIVLPVRAGTQLLWSPCTSGPVLARNHVVTIHDTFPIDNPEWYSPSFARWYGWLIRQLSRSAQHIIAVSDYTRERLLALTGIRPERVSTIYHGIGDDFRPQSATRCDAMRRALQLPTRRYLLSVSSLESRKNLGCVLSAWAAIHTRIPGEVWLVLAGPKADPKVFGEHNLPDIPPRVCFTGYVPEEYLPSLYSGADAFLYPSLGEGFGLPLVEAFACGAPCIAARTGSLPEISAGAAILVDPKRPDELAMSILHLLESAEMRNTYSAKGLQRATRFNWDVAADETLSVFAKLHPAVAHAIQA
jgi:glycosyltransferase involved in cell wall biosynthesis